jgi:hypothetical protein
MTTGTSPLIQREAGCDGCGAGRHRILYRGRLRVSMRPSFRWMFLSRPCAERDRSPRAERDEKRSVAN